MKSRTNWSWACSGFILFTAMAYGQAFNIDCGGVLGTTPSDEYGAGASQAGYWNPTSDVATGLRDINGMLTNSSFASGGGARIREIAGASGDDERLMESSLTLQASDFTGVQGLNAGRYDVYVYSWFPLTSGMRTVQIRARNGDGVTEVPATITFGGSWPGQQVEGETFAKLTIDVIDGRNFIRLSIFGGVGENPTNDLNGIQIVPIPAPCSASLCLALGALALRRRR